MTPRMLVVTVVAALAFAGCGNLFDPAAAVVAGDKVSMDEVQAAVDDFQQSPEFERLSQQGDSDAITREFEQSYLSTLIRRAVLQPEAEEMDVEVTDEEVQEQLERIQADFPSQSAFEEALREQGLTLEQLEQLIADRALEDRLREAVTEDVGPTEEDIEEHFETNRDDFQETEAQHILVEERSLARRIARELQDAPRRNVDAVFARLARRHSIDTSNKDSAGELGFFRPGDFVSEFESAAAELDIDEISDPVQSEFGWHVIRVTDRRDLTLEQASEQIARQLGGAAEEDAWQTWLEEVFTVAEVKVNPRFGEFNIQTQQIEDASARTTPGANTIPPPVPPGEEGEEGSP